MKFNIKGLLKKLVTTKKGWIGIGIFIAVIFLAVLLFKLRVFFAILFLVLVLVACFFLYRKIKKIRDKKKRFDDDPDVQ